jgi:hypothetical protein
MHECQSKTSRISQRAISPPGHAPTVSTVSVCSPPVSSVFSATANMRLLMQKTVDIANWIHVRGRGLATTLNIRKATTAAPQIILVCMAMRILKVCFLCLEALETMRVTSTHRQRCVIYYFSTHTIRNQNVHVLGLRN